jgi:PAS domain-containing protein
VIYACQPEPPYELTWLCENTSHAIDNSREEPLAEEDTWIGHAHPDDRETVQDAYDRLQEHPETGTVEYEYRVVLPQGTRWLHETARAITGDGGQILEVIATAIDVTDRVEAERERRKAQLRLQQVIGQLDTILFSFDPNGYYQLAEGRGLEALGLEPSDVRGQHLTDFYGEREMALFDRACQGEPVRDTIECEGTMMEVHMSTPCEDGELVDPVARDRLVLKAQQLYERVLEGAQALVFRVRGAPGEGDVEFLGPTVEAVTGSPAGAYDEDPQLWFGSTHPDDRERFAETTRRLYEEGKPRDRTYRFEHGETGEWVWLDEHVMPDRDAHGTVIGFTGFAREVPPCIVHIDRDGELRTPTSRPETCSGWNRPR